MNATLNLTSLAEAKLSKPRPAPKRLGIVDMVKLSTQAKHRMAMGVGAVFGGFVPVATFTVAHFELDFTKALYTQIGALLVLGGLLYSARTVYEWASLAFRNVTKAVGFVVLLEGVMVASTTTWLGYAALALLVVVNAVAVGTNLVLDQRELRAADAR